MSKLEDGFYWAKDTDQFAYIGIVEVSTYNGRQVVSCVGCSEGFELSEFNFGDNPKPIEKPDWCNN